MNLLGNSNRGQSRLKARAAVIALAAGLGVTGVSADTLAQPKDNTLERQAAQYISFREDVAAIEAMPFTNANVTREAHKRLAAHDANGLSTGWVAYAALVAADQPGFAEALEKELKKKPNKRKGELGGIEGLMSNVAQDPAYLRKMPGAQDAVNAILAMTVQDGARITELGEAFKSQAYAMQKTSWGKQKILPSQKRLDEAATYSRSRGQPAAPQFASTTENGVTAPALASAQGQWAANWGADAASGRPNEPSADVVVDRVLILAARYSTGTLNPKIVEAYARNDKSQRCLSMAKLTLDQCIAATRAPYEEAFCLGEHGLKDVATCTSWVAGG
ncbi:MAG: hypothetical protein R3C58_08875 [Parvularculaceae bacterium]